MFCSPVHGDFSQKWLEPIATRAGGVQASSSCVMRSNRSPIQRHRPQVVGDLPMTSSEVADLAADGLFDIGGHTVTHPALPTLPPSEQADEILHGRLACEQIVNRSIAGFAYPHGALDSESRAAVRACGFRWACSTEARPVPVRDYDRYALPRLAVSDCDGPAFERALQAACA